MRLIKVFKIHYKQRACGQIALHESASVPGITAEFEKPVGPTITTIAAQ